MTADTRVPVHAGWLSLLALFLLAGAPAYGRVELRPTPEDGFAYSYGPWRSCKIGGGGYVLAVVPAPSDPDVYYAHIDVGGCLRSEDGGRTWRMLHGSLPPLGRGLYECRSLAVHPKNADVVYIAVGSRWHGGQGVWKSMDGGRTWRLLLDKRFLGNGNNRWTGQVLAIDLNDPQRVWTGTCGEGVWLSRNSGESWTNMGLEREHFSHVLVDRANPNRVWIGASAPVRTGRGDTSLPGMWRTDDGGKTWKTLYEGRPCLEFVQDPKNAAMLYEVRGHDGVHRSMDAGATWEPMNDGLPLDHDEQDRSYQAIGAGPDFIVVSDWRGRLYRLEAGGNEWVPQPFEREHSGDWFGRSEVGEWQHRGAATSSVTVDPHDPGKYWVTDWFAMWEVANRGTDWTLRIDGLEDTVIHTVVPDPQNPAIVHLGMADNGYFVSWDGGQSFRQAKGLGNNIKSIAVSRSDPRIVYGTGAHKWGATEVYVSFDRGRSWQRRPALGLPENPVGALNTIAVDPRDSALLYVTVAHDTGTGVYRSVDGGVSWHCVTSSIPVEHKFEGSIWGPGRQLAVGADGTLYVSYDAGTRAVWRSGDQGQTWRKVTLPADIRQPEAIAAHPAETGIVLLASENGLWRTEDDGDTWRRVHEEEVAVAQFAPRAPHVAIATTPAGPIASSDAGLTWNRLDQAIPDKIGGRPCCTGERVLIGTSGSGVFWAPVTEEGRHLLAERVPDDDPAEDPAGKLPIPIVRNGDMETSGDAAVEGWTHIWTGEGKVNAYQSRDAHSGRFSLALEAVGGSAVATINQPIDPMPYAFHVEAYAKKKGPGYAQLAFQVWDARGEEIDWIYVGALRGEIGWTRLAGSVMLPPEAEAANFLLLLRGEGTVLLDDVTFSHP